MTQTKQMPMSAKFNNAEQLWFWFLYSKQVRNDFHCGPNSRTRRICDVLDIETLVTKLYLSGKLTDKHLNVMKDFGDRRRAPNPHMVRENKASEIWHNAMDIIQDAAIKKGWIY